jgi:hypothetical protein
MSRSDEELRASGEPRYPNPEGLGEEGFQGAFSDLARDWWERRKGRKEERKRERQLRRGEPVAPQKTHWAPTGKDRARVEEFRKLKEEQAKEG